MNPLEKFEISGRVSIHSGPAGLPVVRIDTPWSEAEIHLHGAHITHFQLKGQAPLLFLSPSSSFDGHSAIRGGVPIIFPWFGPRPDSPATASPGPPPGLSRNPSSRRIDRVRLVFRLPPLAGVQVAFTVTVGPSLMMELSTTNRGETDFAFENCLHTYFHIGSVDKVAITGLHGTRYIDKVLNTTSFDIVETIRIDAEVDRVYQNTGSTVEITDAKLRRIIRVRKSGSLSTIVWNPWAGKSRTLSDLGNDDYQHMVCVESGNVGINSIVLPSGERSTMTVEIDTLPLS